MAVELQMAQAEQRAQADQAEYLRSQQAMLAEQERVAREVHAASTEAHRSEMAVLRAQLELQRAVARSTRGSRASSVAAPEPAPGIGTDEELGLFVPLPQASPKASPSSSRAEDFQLFGQGSHNTTPVDGGIARVEPSSPTRDLGSGIARALVPVVMGPIATASRPLIMCPVAAGTPVPLGPQPSAGSPGLGDRPMPAGLLGARQAVPGNDAPREGTA